MAVITFNGKRSSDFGLRIVNDVSHESAVYDVEKVEVVGRDGVLLKDNHRLKPVVKEFPCRVSDKSGMVHAQEGLSEWLGVKGFKPLVLSWDSQYTYLATHLEGFSIQELAKAFGSIKLSFLVHPIKFKTASMEFRRVTSGQTLVNSGNVVAKPIIKITGSGDVDLIINGRHTRLRNLQGGIVLDMFNHLVYFDVLAKWDSIVRGGDNQLPYLDIGNNVITWSGNVSVEIASYIGVKV